MRFVRLLALGLAIFAATDVAADPIGKTSVRTNTAGDVTVTLSDGTTPANLAQIAASNGLAAANGLFILGGAYNSALPTNTSGRSVALQTDINGRLIVTQDASAGAMLMNLTKVGGTAIALGQTTMSASIPFVIASDQSNLPMNIKQVNGATLALGQTTKSASIPITLPSDIGTLAVSQGAPTGAATADGTAVSIGTGATSTLTCVGSLTASTPLKLYQVVITGAAQGRCTVRYNNNATPTNWLDVVTTAATPTVAVPCPAGFCAITAGASGTQAIEASCTNNDAFTQSFSCSVQYCSAASGC